MSSSSLPLKTFAAAVWETAFALHAEAVVSGTYYQGGSSLASCSALKSVVRAWECDGSVLKAGDEKLHIRVSEVGKTFQPASGDSFTETGGTVFHDVIAGALDPTETVWTLYTRRRI